MPGMNHAGSAGEERAVVANRDQLRVKLRELAAQSLCVSPSDVPFDGDLGTLGLDSVLAVEFVLQVNDLTGAGLTVEDLQHHRTIHLLADLLT